MHRENIVSVKAEVYMVAIDRYNALNTDENPYSVNDRRHVLFEFVKRAILQWLPPPTGKSIWDKTTDSVREIQLIRNINYSVSLLDRFYVPDGISEDILDACLCSKKGDAR